MKNIIINPKDQEEWKFITELLQKLGIGTLSHEEFELQRKKEAMNRFAEMVENSPKIDITDEEIDAMVDEVRAKRYAEKNNH